MDFLATHPNYPRLIQREAMESSPGFEWISRNFLGPFQNTLNKTIEAGVRAREFRELDARHAVFSILGMTTFYFVAARRFPATFQTAMPSRQNPRGTEKSHARLADARSVATPDRRQAMTGKKFFIIFSARW